jgi:SAM-dependent methyltransferase
MIDLETANYLLSPDGDELLEIAKELDGSFLQRVTILRKRYTAPVASAALDLLELRHRARKKFSRAGEMFFTREALEQSSGESISNYRAERFAKDSRVLDLACGIGGDMIGLAGRCFVTAVDIDPVKIAMAERNARVYGLADRVKFVCADVTEIQLDEDAAFLDPSRRIGGRRSTSLLQMSPSLEFVHRLRESIPECAVKLSPATNDDELESLDGEIEFISDSGECKEAVVWFGGFKSADKRATILPERV